LKFNIEIGKIRLLNTLAQSETSHAPNNALILSGKGSDLSNEITAKRRAKRKVIGNKLSLHLIDIDKEKGKGKKSKTLWNTYHCQNRLYYSEGRTFGKYCKNRACPLCLSIRKAVLINKYLPIIKEWKQPYYIVLTAKAVSAKHLAKRVAQMINRFQRIKNRIKTRHARGNGPKLIGIRTIEANYNAEKKTYNPHFNFIVQTKEMADLLMAEWLKMLTPKFANKKGQYMRSIENELQQLIEVIKYGSKIFTEPDLKKKGKDGKVYALALYNILSAFEGHRLFERFGFNGPKETKKDNRLSMVVDYDIYYWDIAKADWIGSKGQSLTDYKLCPQLDYLITERVDFNSE
jgi:hypothetical protein